MTFPSDPYHLCATVTVRVEHSDFVIQNIAAMYIISVPPETDLGITALLRFSDSSRKTYND